MATTDTGFKGTSLGICPRDLKIPLERTGLPNRS